MSTWQEQVTRFKLYFTGPWSKVSIGLGFLFQARPVCLGGSPRPANISASDYATGQLFQKYSAGFKTYEATTSVPSLAASVYGVVLEIGPGVGNQLGYFDKSKITQLYGVEPNPTVVPYLLAEVERTALQGKYTLVLASVEDEELLANHGLVENSVDSIVCLQTLCAIKDPELAMRLMYKLLKPGGVFLFWEHRRSYDFITRVVQDVWNPLWKLTMGCNLNRSTSDFIRRAGNWDLAASELVEQNDPAAQWSILPRVEGRMVKSSRKS